MYIAIEAGGTKFVCAYGNSPEQLKERTRIETRDPESTMQDVIEYIHRVAKEETLDGIGLACFGPLSLDRSSESYGSITNTPKLKWKDFPVVTVLEDEFHVPVGFDTDVNAAALGEYRWGAGKGCGSLLYITVGTGVGLGAVLDGIPVHGAMHPEAGHILLPHNLEKDPFEGVCPYHKGCFEGLASGPSLSKRWGVESATDLPPDHQAWDLEANYLAMAMMNYTLCYSPHRIVLGGGVMQSPGLIEKTRIKMGLLLADYVKNSSVDQLDTYLVPPGLGQNSGIVGAWVLADMESHYLKQGV